MKMKTGSWKNWNAHPAESEPMGGWRKGEFAMPNSKKIAGIEPIIIDRIIRMIREKFPKFNAGTRFLAFLGFENDIGYRNIRDMLTHINIAISDEHISFRDREIQVALAEEHLRRALVEPFEVGASEEFKLSRDLYKEFTSLTAQAKKKDKLFFQAPAEAHIRERFLKIHSFMNMGRDKKAVNLWSAEWEQAVIHFHDAAEEAKELNSKLSADIEILKHESLSRKNARYFWWGVIATVLVGLLGIAVSLLLYLLSIQHNGTVGLMQ